MVKHGFCKPALGVQVPLEAVLKCVTQVYQAILLQSLLFMSSDNKRLSHSYRRGFGKGFSFLSWKECVSPGRYTGVIFQDSSMAERPAVNR